MDVTCDITQDLEIAYKGNDCQYIYHVASLPNVYRPIYIYIYIYIYTWILNASKKRAGNNKGTEERPHIISRCKNFKNKFVLYGMPWRLKKVQ